MHFGRNDSVEEQPATYGDMPAIVENGQRTQLTESSPRMSGALTQPYFIVQRTDSGEQKIYICDGATETRVFMESLISEGAQREHVHLFRASSVPYYVRFKPTVGFDTSANS